MAEVHIADAKACAAGEAESVAELISFQVTQAYHQMVTARKGIDRAKPSVEQATENYRLVRARFAQGDATPSEIIEAETALTRAQQNYLNSNYDYLAALAGLEYAMGTNASSCR